MEDTNTHDIVTDVHEVAENKVDQLPQEEVVDLTPSTEFAELEIVAPEEEEGK